MIVDHYRKVGTAAGLLAVGKHNQRAGAYLADGRPAGGKWAAILTHPEQAHLNEYSGQDPSQLLQARRDRIAAANLTRKPQKNASVAVEAVISASPEFFQNLSHEQKKRYFQVARAWLGNEFGKEAILGWAVHYDEKTPHMHVLMVPLTKTKEIRKRDKQSGLPDYRQLVETDSWAYSSSRFLGGPDGLIRHHDSLAATLRPFGVQRGSVGRHARHTAQQEWARDLPRRAKALDQREAALAAREKALGEPVKPLVIRLKEKESPNPFKEYRLSDGGKVKGWDNYKLTEMAIQSLASRNDLAERLQAVQVRNKDLEQTNDAYGKALVQWQSLSPATLRAEADRKEAEQAQKPSLSPRREKNRDEGMGW